MVYISAESSAMKNKPVETKVLPKRLYFYQIREKRFDASWYTLVYGEPKNRQKSLFM